MAPGPDAKALTSGLVVNTSPVIFLGRAVIIYGFTDCQEILYIILARLYVDCIFTYRGSDCIYRKHGSLRAVCLHNLRGFIGVKGKFVCLRIDPELVKSEVKYESGEPMACLQLFGNLDHVIGTSI